MVVTPAGRDTLAFEWDFINDGAADLALYDDLRSCAYEQPDIDLHRISATGISAGGLWTSFLAIHRGDTLATVLPWSGGTDPVVAYQPPAAQLPVLLAWGGSGDTWGNGSFMVEFEQTTLAFSDQLQADGHFVVECDHGAGHTIPMQGRNIMDAWLFGHEVGVTSRFKDGDLSDLPDYCGTP